MPNRPLSVASLSQIAMVTQHHVGEDARCVWGLCFQSGTVNFFSWKPAHYEDWSLVDPDRCPATGWRSLLFMNCVNGKRGQKVGSVLNHTHQSPALLTVACCTEGKSNPGSICGAVEQSPACPVCLAIITKLAIKSTPKTPKHTTHREKNKCPSS